MSAIESIGQIISTISDTISMYEFLDKIRGSIFEGKKNNKPTPELLGFESTLYGSRQNAADANSSLVNILRSKPFPFIIRSGHHFTIPADITEMKLAIKSGDVYDWTFFFTGNENDNMIEAKSEIRESYFSPPKHMDVRKDIGTSQLSVFSSKHDESLGDATYIAGMVVADRGFDNFSSMERRQFLPSIGITVRHGMSYAITDPIGVNFLFDKLRSVVIDEHKHLIGSITVSNGPENKPEDYQLRVHNLTSLLRHL
ncbi:hypothetical protein [Niveispirillum cyanobacteriorum]|uniref:hypothetical protein n=1 Tax=Niveispirillum cyanobacteriorum TaxID=1612173 RepID=UPI00131A3A1E|nr:hypothetical protein [Niveispirillum cyanobacteriorum]GGE46222.1 hypothetical protein GCM10011317_00800 [Niveispirillum cyanobacteriorum]